MTKSKAKKKENHILKEKGSIEYDTSKLFGDIDDQWKRYKHNKLIMGCKKMEACYMNDLTIGDTVVIKKVKPRKAKLSRESKYFTVTNCDDSITLYPADPTGYQNTIKFKKQRATNGFADCDVWDLESTIISFIYPRLCYFRKKIVDGENMSIPGRYIDPKPDGNYTSDEQVEAKKKYLSDLNDMILGFAIHLAEDEDPFIKDLFKSIYPDKNLDDIPYEFRNKLEMKASKLLGELLYELWD